MFKKTFVLAAVLLVLTAMFIVQESRDPKRNTLQIASLPEEIDTVTIEQGGEELVLSREGSAWYVGAEAYPGSAETISDYIDLFRGLGEVEVISGRANYQQYDLTGEGTYDVSFEQEGAEVLRVTLGATAAAGNAVYGRINRGPEVVLLPQRIRQQSSVDPTEYRDKQMARIPAEDIVAVRVSGPEYGAIELTRAEEPELPEEATEVERIDAIWQAEAPDPVEASRIQNFLQELANLRAEDFPAGPPEGPSFATVTLQLRDGGRERFELYPPEENLYPLTTTASEYPFYVAEWRARRLLLGTPQYFEPFQGEPTE